VVALADALSPGDPVVLIGHDWGAVAAYGAVAAACHRFSHLVTIAVPPPRIRDFLRPAQLVRSSYMALFQLPGAERIVSARDGAFVESLWRAWSPGFSPPRDVLRAAKAAVLADPTAVLGYYRQLPRSLPLPLPPRSLPHLHLHGDRDGCVGVETARRSGAGEVGILSGGHFLHLEAPAAVNARLLSFLGRSSLRDR
jgi:pimeloyl-ACP methyl ester carboxylesterase